jgi:hypothetical protein
VQHAALCIALSCLSSLRSSFNSPGQRAADCRIIPNAPRGRARRVVSYAERRQTTAPAPNCQCGTGPLKTLIKNTNSNLPLMKLLLKAGQDRKLCLMRASEPDRRVASPDRLMEPVFALYSAGGNNSSRRHLIAGIRSDLPGEITRAGNGSMSMTVQQVSISSSRKDQNWPLASLLTARWPLDNLRCCLSGRALFCPMANPL